jgi:O-acetyl-ADP-ribose deacetylase (regulator of RNase III)
MKEISGNIWDFQKDGVICVTTNGDIKSNGYLVMGKGVALQASDKFPGLSKELGHLVKEYGNRPFYFKEFNIMTVPTKYHWKDNSDIDLIKKSCRALPRFADYWKMENIYMPRLGCGLGGLKWENVKNAIDTILDDRFIVVSND